MNAIKTFLAYFLKLQVLSDDPAKLLKLDLEDKSIWLPDTQMFFGSAKRELVNGINEKKPLLEEVVLTLRIAFIKTGKYLLKKQVPRYQF